MTPPDEKPSPASRLFFIAAIGTGTFFLAWSYLVFGRAQFNAFDHTCAVYWHENAEEHVGFWNILVFFTEFGGVAAMTLLTIVGALWQASLKNRVLALGWIAVMIGCGILNNGSKELFGRARPDEKLRDHTVYETNKSYPSGHAMGSPIGYGFLAYCLCLWQRDLRIRLLIVAVTIAVIAAIGFSRIYLRAHWFSDVIGGWGFGLTWLFFCLGWLERWRQAPP